MHPDYRPDRVFVFLTVLSTKPGVPAHSHGMQPRSVGKKVKVQNQASDITVIYACYAN